MSIYTDVTSRILKQLDEGVVPWRKTWSSALPKNLTTGKEYRGINIVTLSSAGFNSRYWLTYRQALNLGGHVRKGERGHQVVYWHWRTSEELENLEGKTGGRQDLAPCTPFISTVFNLEQVEGVPSPVDDFVSNTAHRLELADGLFSVMPDRPEIVHSRFEVPSYCFELDRIVLPHLSQFESADEYYVTLFHELVHATAHPRRLYRADARRTNETELYSFEELVAEFGAAFLCAFAGINNPETEALSASYIHGWAQAFRRDHRLLLRAASAAQRAADYIRGKVIPKTETAEAEQSEQCAPTTV